MKASQIKIAHLTSVHRPFDVRIFDKHCRSFADAGFSVVLVVPNDQDVELDGVNLRAVPQPMNRFSRMTLTAFRVFREARRQKADLYIIHDPELLPWAKLLRMMGHTIIYDMHENLPKDILSKTWIPRWVRWPIARSMQLVERLLMAGMPVIFAESSYATDYAWVQQSVVVRNFAKTSLFGEIATRSSKPAVAYVGAVSPDRGSLTTLAALCELKRRGVTVGWQCVGPVSPPEHEQELKEFVRKHELPDVNFYGYLERANAVEKIEACHVGLAILLPEPNFVSSYPTKLFEYMALGMPVIASDFPLYRDVVEGCQCGICVDPMSVSQVADAIQRLIEQPEMAARLGQQGRQAVQETYNWEREFPKLSQFYEQVQRTRRSRTT